MDGEAEWSPPEVKTSKMGSRNNVSSLLVVQIVTSSEPRKDIAMEGMFSMWPQNSHKINSCPKCNIETTEILLYVKQVLYSMLCLVLLDIIKNKSNKTMTTYRIR